MFEQRFIHRFYRFMTKSLAKKMSPTFIWTEIMSVIKGSINVDYCVQKYLGREEYLHQGSPILTKAEK